MPSARPAALPALEVALDEGAAAGDSFLGRTQNSSLPRLFGGLVAAQALAAAGLTVGADRPVHSVHAYFLRPGTALRSVRYEVSRVRDSRSFSTRLVTGLQDGRPVLHLSADFHRPEDGLEHQKAPPSAPDPDEIDSGLPLPVAERVEQEWPEWELKMVAADLLDPTRLGHTQVWLRLRESLPDDPGAHACALLYASDMTLLSTLVRAHGKPAITHGMTLASLDHAMWFHRPFRADEWLLYDQESPTAAGGRGLTVGRIHDLVGRHVATVAQEGLLRS